MPATAPKLVMVVLAGAVGGCLPTEGASFEATAPNKRLDAIVLASSADDAASMGGLVGQLESSDPAARMLAIQALEKRTGMTLGYRHSDPEWKRRAAVDRWRKHVAALEAERVTTASNPGGPAQ